MVEGGRREIIQSSVRGVKEDDQKKRKKEREHLELNLPSSK